MNARHARYPFLGTARESVREADADLVTIAGSEPVRSRALERVTGALETGSVGDPRRDARTELLSYPLARVLVSLVDEHVLTRKYARAEAASAHERLVADAETTALKSVRDEPLSITDLLVEFDLEAHVHRIGSTEGEQTVAEQAGNERVVTDEPPTPSGVDEPDADPAYRIDVGAYLPLAADLWGDEWRLVNRALADGEIPITRAELGDLLRAAIEDRVAAGLPFEVPDPVAETLEDAATAVRERLADLELTRDIDTVVPDLFPPCMTALLDSIQKGEHLPHHSRFAITAFLSSIGMDTDEIVELYMVNPGFGEDITRYQTDHIRGETSPTEYSSPSCATMQSYGDCVNMDDRCETISHPMAYYEAALDDADEETTDWRERDDGDETEPEADAEA